MSDIISDKDYQILKEKGFLIAKEVRNYNLRRKFKEMKDAGMRSDEAAMILSQEHKLKFGTCRKIIFGTNNKKKGAING